MAFTSFWRGGGGMCALFLNAESVSIVFLITKPPRVFLCLYISSSYEEMMAFCTLRGREIYYVQPVHLMTHKV